MVSMALLLLLLLLCAVSHYGSTVWVNSFAGPYMAYVEKFYRCPNVDYSNHLAFYNWWPSFYRPHYRTLQTISGNASVLRDIKDEDAWMSIRLDTWSNNQWKENAFLFDFPSHLCSNLRMHMPNMWLLFYSTSTLKGPCIIGKGFWTWDRKPINWTFPHFPVMPYGKWRFLLRMGLTGSAAIRCCLAAEVVTTPKITW